MGSYFGTGDCYFEQQFTVDDLLVDFPIDDDDSVINNDSFFNSTASNSPGSGNETQFSGNMSSYSLSDSQFSGGELCVPYDELAELEWLSTLAEESFSTDDLNNLRLISPVNKSPSTDTSSSDTNKTSFGSNRINSPIFQNDVLVPGKVRSKRSRAAPCDWSSRIFHVKTTSPAAEIKLENKPDSSRSGSENAVRRCLHCGSDKTPQWRRGPMGPKTLCNACGVRFKSGRLVPEYRPAASPSFVPAKHSNSHRKVMELRRQMELRNAQQQMITNHGSNFDGCDDYLIHSQMGPNFMHMN
ncbi:GATA transcription factor 12-like [Rutidosis leptorrhynchoides]|uniref:GATA transcription factor 12-like n=1 Tax=Rutidosis leptorrhynchoides TaxID=125765 RepID=UPI003A990D8E